MDAIPVHWPEEIHKETCCLEATLMSVEYVLASVSKGQDFLDWWQGPIGFMLPAADQWDNYFVQSAAIAAAGSYLGPVLTRYAERPVLRSAGTRVISREIVKQQTKRIGLARIAAVMTISVPTPVSLIFWTLVLAYSIPPTTVPKHPGLPVGLPIFTGDGYHPQ